MYRFIPVVAAATWSLSLASGAAAQASFDANEMLSPAAVAKIKAAYADHTTGAKRFNIVLEAAPVEFDANEALSPAHVKRIKAAYDERPLSDRYEDGEAGF